MIRINLLPFRAARKKENVRRQISISLLTFSLIIIVVVWYNIFLSNQITDMKARNDNTKAQIAKYEKINKEIAGIKRKLRNLNQKIKVIETLEGNRKKAVLLLDSMTGLIIPERMWFTNLDVVGDNISLKGIALDERTIADFMKNLEKLYGNVALKSIGQRKIKGKSLNLKDFSLTLTRAQPQTDPAKKAKKS
jgi:type IV pilus assembly protein PilN